MSKSHIRRSNLRDDSMHVVVDCSSDHIDKEDLDVNFITPFQLKLNDSGLKILPIEVITQPLVVVTNYKAPEQTHYLACLPKSKWHCFFSRRIRNVFNGESDIEDDKNIPWWNNCELFVDKIESTSEEEEEEGDDSGLKEPREYHKNQEHGDGGVEEEEGYLV